MEYIGEILIVVMLSGLSWNTCKCPDLEPYGAALAVLTIILAAALFAREYPVQPSDTAFIERKGNILHFRGQSVVLDTITHWECPRGRTTVYFSGNGGRASLNMTCSEFKKHYSLYKKGKV